jgi:hypothetical protein
MPMLIYKPLQATPTEFVQFWSLRYVYAKEYLYNDSIDHELTEQRILDLFEWKNGIPLSKLKQASVRRNFVQRRRELLQLQPNLEPGNFLAHFPKGGAIWRIFWLHCWQPLRFPIYDQHVHRAMTFIQTGACAEIPAYDPRKVNSYIRRYLPFHATFDGIDSRSVDKALWAFGRFLNEANFPTVALDN